MPRNDYFCQRHGIRELWFSGEPPRKCPECDGPVTLVVAPNQFTLSGDVGQIDEAWRRTAHLQLGERVETRQELRELERRKGFVPMTKSEFHNTGDDYSFRPKKLDSGKIVRQAIESAKKDGTFPRN